MNLWQKIGYYLLVGLCKVAGSFPYAFLYRVFSPVLYFLLYRVVRYRLGVVRRNLENSFPEKTKEERCSIERGFYKNLSEVFVSNIELCALSRRKLAERFIITNREEFDPQVEGRTWICAMAHYGSWEFSSTYQLHAPGHSVVGVYRPLHSVVFDEFYKYTRSRCGSVPVPMHGIAKKIISSKREELPLVIALIGDQTPPWHEINHWFDFLNQPTPFFMGAEKLSLKFGLPVYFLHQTSPRKGFFENRFEMIYDGTESVGEFEITERYARKLEGMIRERPELWLWSHKRWKHTPSKIQR